VICKPKHAFGDPSPNGRYVTRSMKKSETPADRPGFSFQRCVGMSARASSSAARHRPHITIIGIQNRNGMLSSSVVLRRDNASNATALRQDFVIG
jgi:hypothetical protein